MLVRDAVERDAPAMATLTDAPESVLGNLVHDRSVRVLVDGSGGPPAPQADGEADVHGFVSFDARADAVHVTEFGGDREACERLLEEPISFARREGLPVEMLLREGEDSPARTGGEGEDSPAQAGGEGEDSPARAGGEADDAMRAAAEAVGFDPAGAGPRFRGVPTTRYRYEPA